VISKNENEFYEEIHFDRFPPGSVLGIKVSLPERSLAAVQQLNAILQDTVPGRCLPEALAGLSLVDFNVLLYRSAVEEFVTTGEGAYHLSNYGYLVYCGLQVLPPTPTHHLMLMDDRVLPVF
jgi:Central domain of human glycogen debranching enzyme